MHRFGLAVSLFTYAIGAQTPEQRAVAYLARETPRWSKENGCFSCHNNGDGARALFAAAKLGYRTSSEAFADTIAWLLRPSEWDHNRANPAFGDKKLARIQFAGALTEAYDAGLVHDAIALRQAAESLLPYQEPDGSWQVDVGSVGSPVTYGAALATYMARRTLEAAHDSRFASSIAKADGWFRRNKPQSATECAAALLALPGSAGLSERLLATQSDDGGWGPYPMAPTEPFDTAVVLLALRKINEPARTGQAIERGRAYLIMRQQESGGWPETTRPPGGQSYAQHISTSAWATLALVLTDSKR